MELHDREEGILLKQGYGSHQSNTDEDYKYEVEEVAAFHETVTWQRHFARNPDAKSRFDSEALWLRKLKEHQIEGILTWDVIKAQLPHQLSLHKDLRSLKLVRLSYTNYRSLLCEAPYGVDPWNIAVVVFSVLQDFRRITGFRYGALQLGRIYVDPKE